MVTLVNRAKMGTSTTGTGTITLGSAETGYQSFADAGVSDSDVVRYVIEDGDDWEIGSGTYTSTGTTLSRTLDESSTGSLLDLSGSAVVFITAAAEDVFQGELVDENYNGTSTAPSATGTNAVAFGSNANASGSSAFAFGTARAQGASSFAVNLGNTGSLYKAGGTNSIAMGSLARAPDNNAIAIGDGAQTAAANAIALGTGSEASNTYSIALGGRYARTGADYSMATGYWSRSHVVGSKVHASGRFSSWGDAQTGTYVLRSDTTNATAEAMTADNGTASSSNQIVLQNESAISFTGTVVCREDATDGDDYAGWEIKGVIMRQGAAADTSLGVGIVNKLYASSGISAADVALSADTTNGCLKIQVTGVASTNLNWVATVNTSEVINA